MIPSLAVGRNPRNLAIPWAPTVYSWLLKSQENGRYLRMDGLVFLPLAAGPAFGFFGQNFITRMREKARGFIVAGKSGIDESIATRVFDDLAKDGPHTAIGVGFQDMRTID